jgi:predicted RNase H-like HicB family nuclease
VFDKPYSFETWIHVSPAEDVPGQWVAHCIANDVISMGNDVEQAIAMVMEACAFTIVDDLEHDRDPLKRGELTPQECREKVTDLIERGIPLTREQMLDGVAKGSVKNFALQASLRIEKVEAVDDNAIESQSMRESTVRLHRDLEVSRRVMRRAFASEASAQAQC